MDKNLNLIASELFSKIRTRFPQITMKDEAGEPVDDEELARSFSFNFVQDGQTLGSVDIDLSEKEGLVVIFSNDLLSGQPEGIRKQWYNFLKELRQFAKGLPFEVRDISKSNLDKRDYEYLANKKQGDMAMSESKLWGGNKTSYQDLGETRLIIKHNQPVNLNIPTGRTMHIENIYIENSQGERFLYPHKHLNGARALAQHIAHGGNPYDDIGQHVISLSEELGSLRKFKNYVSRTPMVAEAMNTINEKVIERIEQIKQDIQSLQKKSHYESFVQSYIKQESTHIPDEIVNDWVDRLTIRTFNEELKNVFPYIYKLIDENSLPVKEVDLNYLYQKDDKKADNSPSISAMAYELPEEREFELFLDNIIGESEDIFSQNPESQSAAIEKLNELISVEMPVGTDGTNVIESLKGIIEDKELEEVFKELSDVNPDADARNILKDYIKIRDEENGTDVLSQLKFSSEPAAEPEPVPEPAAAPEPVPQPAAAPAAPPSMPITPGVAMAENIKRVVERAKRAGMTAEDTFTLFGEEVSLADAIRRAGLNINEFFDQGYTDSGDEVVEFVKSMFDENGNTPKGPTGVLISVEKKFGEEALDKAKHIMNELMSQAEMRRIQELSGLR